MLNKIVFMIHYLDKISGLGKTFTVVNRVHNEVCDTSRYVTDQVQGTKMFFRKELQIKPSFSNKEKCSDNWEYKA